MNLERLVWTVAAAGVGWLGSVTTYQAQTVQLRKDVAELHRRQALEMQLLAAVAEKSGVQSEYIAVVRQMAAPTEGGQ